MQDLYDILRMGNCIISKILVGTLCADLRIERIDVWYN